MSILINIENISYRRDGAVLLDQVSWQVRSGEHWALLGQNGSGKTTLMKMVAGWIFPSSGHVEVLGRRYGETDLTVLRTHIGWVSPVISEEISARLTAREVVLSGCLGTIGLFEEPTDEMRDDAEFFLGLMEATAFADRAFGILSQGERMRTVIARALAARPVLLILDEPCAGLDPVAREHFLETLDILTGHADAPPVLLVTHHVEEIFPGITHILALRQGRIAAAGPKEDILCPEALEQIFGCEFTLERHGDRWWAKPI
jgi:iron complex transport system ATP-binding protein